MDGSSFGPGRAQELGFHPRSDHALDDRAAPGPGAGPLPEREWGLSAGQVVVVVLAIIAVCELIGVLS